MAPGGGLVTVLTTPASSVSHPPGAPIWGQALPTGGVTAERQGVLRSRPGMWGEPQRVPPGPDAFLWDQAGSSLRRLGKEAVFGEA